MQNSISNNTIDFSAVKEANNLIDVAARYVEMEKRGNEYECICPFHDDSKPSCTFFPGSDGYWRYYCFPCGASGDVIDFVAGMNNCNASEAIKILNGGDLLENTTAYQHPVIKPNETKCWVPIIPVPDDAPEYVPAETFNPKPGEFRRHTPVRIDPLLRWPLAV